MQIDESDFTICPDAGQEAIFKVRKIEEETRDGNYGFYICLFIYLLIILAGFSL